MPKARLVRDAAFTIGPVPHRLYEPDYPGADEADLRTDVLELTREIGPIVLHHPGRNSVPNYRWKDSVGGGPTAGKPIANLPRRPGWCSRSGLGSPDPARR